MAKDWQWKVALAAISVAAVTLIYSQRRRRWKAVGKLSKICIYPLKSGRFKEISSAECTPLGLRVPSEDGAVMLRDRVFMIYDEEALEMVSARKYPTLIFITCQPTNRKTVILSHPDKKEIEFPIPSGKFGEVTVRMWFNEQMKIMDCGDEVAEWISEVATGSRKGLRLSYWPEEETERRDVLAKRPLEVPVFTKMSNNYSGAYSDFASYLLVCQSSVDDLNEKIGDPEYKAHPLDFRPNFVVEGTIPYEEDKWDRVKIGEVEFTNFRPCTRCIFTTIGHTTGEKNPKNEPLKTLRTYRTMKMVYDTDIEGSIPVMGVFVGLEAVGKVKEGDVVYVS
uniref:Molybdopterin cofactor sulfurase n=1 Tax=Riptortus pedestris TaxID=329032 RepID=R4WI76_RIPPE|nr:molybdopterin cofactor sulfurase [Riptortus pedestris]